MTKLTFSGHESFTCKQFWLKKVYDFASEKKRFGDDNAVVDLGVGKNMVASLRYWGKSFGVLDENDTPTMIADYLFGNQGKDMYLEDLATLLLLHYHLVKSNKFSVANLFFNQFRKERLEFTKVHFLSYLQRVIKEHEYNTDNKNSIEKDANILIRMYSKPEGSEVATVEDDYSGILIDLDVLQRFKQRNEEGRITEWYKLAPSENAGIPSEIIVYCILDNYPGQVSISFRELLAGENSPGSIFTLSTEGLFLHLSNIAAKYHKLFVYTETAGNQVFQIKKAVTKEYILDEYYNQ